MISKVLSSPNLLEFSLEVYVMSSKIIAIVLWAKNTRKCTVLFCVNLYLTYSQIMFSDSTCNEETQKSLAIWQCWWNTAIKEPYLKRSLPHLGYPHTQPCILTEFCFLGSKLSCKCFLREWKIDLGIQV